MPEKYTPPGAEEWTAPKNRKSIREKSEAGLAFPNEPVMETPERVGLTFPKIELTSANLERPVSEIPIKVTNESVKDWSIPPITEDGGQMMISRESIINYLYNNGDHGRSKVDTYVSEDTKYLSVKEAARIMGEYGHGYRTRHLFEESIIDMVRSTWEERKEFIDRLKRV